MVRKSTRVRQPQDTRHQLETLEDVKRKFGTTPFDRWEWPVENIHDEPTRCLKVNLEWWPLIAGWLSVLAQPRVWKDVLTKDAHPVEQILELMIGEDCMPFELRQDTVNPCLIEQTLDGGDTWLPAFDLSLCLSIVDGSSGATTVNNFYTSAFSLFEENVYNFFIANYVNKITNIVPELGYGDEFDGNRDEALCFALNRYVDIISEQAIEYFDGLDETADDLRTNLAIAGAIIGIIALAATGVGTPAAILLASQAALWAGGIGIATFLGVALFDHFTGTNRSAYEDLEARHDVVCCLLDALKGADVDRDDFQGAFACAGLSTNAQAIHDAAGIIAGEDATYAAFIENMRIGFASSKLGLLPFCDCAPPGWFWELVPWEWTWTTHSGGVLSDVFAHTNPSDSQLFSVTAIFTSSLPDKNKIRPMDTGLSDSLWVGSPLNVGLGHRLWEDAVVGVMEGADAVDWPVGLRKDVDMDATLRLAGETFSFQWRHEVDLGHSRDGQVTEVRLLYKEV